MTDVDLQRWISAIHRYFPEWAQRPAEPGVPREAERNSYLAGGYAEEFGYLTSAGWSPALPALDDDPERSRWWSKQIGALHPGYPERPAPLDWADAGEHIAAMPARVHAGEHGVIERAAAVNFKVIRVGRATRPARAEGSRLHSLMRALRIRGREPGR